jgi:flagellar protein FlbT
MTLRISLRDGEKMIVNGAVMRAIGRTDFVVENNVSLLRGREVMAVEDAVTPARRLYFACMMAYIDPSSRTTHHEAIIEFLDGLLGALESLEGKALCARFARKVATGNYYRALADCRLLIDYETAALERAVPQAA